MVVWVDFVYEYQFSAQIEVALRVNDEDGGWNWGFSFGCVGFEVPLSPKKAIFLQHNWKLGIYFFRLHA